MKIPKHLDVLGERADVGLIPSRSREPPSQGQCLSPPKSKNRPEVLATSRAHGPPWKGLELPVCSVGAMKELLGEPSAFIPCALAAGSTSLSFVSDFSTGLCWSMEIVLSFAVVPCLPLPEILMDRIVRHRTALHKQRKMACTEKIHVEKLEKRWPP